MTAFFKRKEPMKQEYSYGAVVYKEEKGKILFLIEYRQLGHISLPKGHIEKGETPYQCALREIMEETNLDVSLYPSFQHKISYSPKPGVWKDVTFFLAKAKTFDLIPQKEEVSEAKWRTLEDALSVLTFDSDKETLKDAANFLEQHEEIKGSCSLQ